MKKFLPVLLILFISSGFFFSFLWSENGKTEEYRYHPKNYLDDPTEIQELPLEYNTLFAGSGNCVLCHGDPVQFPGTNANQDAASNDVSPITTWRATMMANAAKDPFWRAKVSHEGLVNPDLKDEIENVCTSCHGPNGFFEAVHTGNLPYTMDNLLADPMALDGVSCTSCHTMTDEGFGTTFSANITYDTNQTTFGPYTNPFTGPMINVTGFTPVYGPHISTSEQCGICHTLITNPLDLDGVPTGTSFVEQAIYHEWLNSDYSAEGTSCQDCHMKKIEEPVVISPLPTNLNARTPFSEHEIAGGNVFMLNLLKNNIDELDLNATTAQFDDVISRTELMLQSALEINIEEGTWTEDGVEIKVTLINKTGHKLPSGYPSRKMYIEFTAFSENQDTIFHSGGINANGRIIGESDSAFEPHYTEITSEDQVQIYELAMGDINADLTTVLEYAYQPLKDNRIPPKGFVNDHFSYDTIPIIGEALNDDNFNYSNSIEGSGSDIIYYKLSPELNYGDAFFVNVKINYLSVPRKWLDEMFEHQSDAIDSFKAMYDQADGTPYLIKESEIFVMLEDIEENNDFIFSVYPNPTADIVNIETKSPASFVEIYNVDGKLIERIDAKSKQSLKIDLPQESGIYVVKVVLEDGRVAARKVLKNN